MSSRVLSCRNRVILNPCAASGKLEVLYSMFYRRFGRTELQMPVFSCGGMRYQQTWGQIEPDAVEPENQANIEATIHRALELGINHIETARGYGSSEMQLGWVLPKLPREKLIVQTKVGPTEDPKEFEERFEKSFSLLQLDHIDLLSFHGINTPQNLDWVLRKGGCMEVVRRLQKEGRVRFVGFSTHGPSDVITQVNATGEFDYFNVHYYYVNQFNWPAIEEATRQDMGVFIISPTDKGGRLQAPSDKMRELCAPLSPMQFNDLWCLSHPHIHTLSIGAARPSDFDDHVNSLASYHDSKAVVAPIESRLEHEVAQTFSDEWEQNWNKCLPEHHEMPENFNAREVLRLLTYGKSFDLLEWASGRYNLMKGNDAWVPGAHVGALDTPEKWAAVAKALQSHPLAAQIHDRLQEAHDLLAGEEAKRLSKGG
jgi:predicted aldo/keto reductase-like oxidoreductase